MSHIPTPADTTNNDHITANASEVGAFPLLEAAEAELCKRNRNTSNKSFSCIDSPDIIRKRRAPNKPIPTLTEEQEARFWSYVDQRGPNECWPWKGTTAPGPKYSSHLRYGRFRIGDKCYGAHRIAFTLVKGPIPDGWTVDHVKAWGCTDTLCTNPNHLQEATQQEQVSRRDAHKVVRPGVSRCKWGHERPIGTTAHCPGCAELHVARHILNNRQKFPGRIEWAERIMADNPGFATAKRYNRTPRQPAPPPSHPDNTEERHGRLLQSEAM